MYTGNTKEETQFLNALWSSHNWGVENGEVKPICECPHCHKGIVMCHYTVGKENGYEFRAYRHVCDTCGEKFEISKIRSDIFFHEAYKWNESLTTPFGEICVTHNGKRIPFRHRKSSDKTSNERLYITPNKMIPIDIIDIDLSDFKVGDFISCGIKGGILKYNSSDERSIFFTCEDDEQIFGLCAYDPDSGQKWYCYSFYDFNGEGVCYRIEADPKSYDSEQFYESKYISLAVACLCKKEFKDADAELFSVLTSIIG